MKALFLFIALLGFLGRSGAQINFGIAYYNVPAGWQVVQQAPNVILEQQRKDGKTCRIILSATEQVVIDNETAYRSYRLRQGSEGFAFRSKDSVIRKENEYCIAYISNTTGLYKNSKMNSTFYSFTNKQATFSVQFIAEPGICDDVLGQFIRSVEVEDAATILPATSTDKTRTKRTSKPRGRPRKNPA